MGKIRQPITAQEAHVQTKAVKKYQELCQSKLSASSQKIAEKEVKHIKERLEIDRTELGKALQEKIRQAIDAGKNHTEIDARFFRQYLAEDNCFIEIGEIYDRLACKYCLKDRECQKVIKEIIWNLTNRKLPYSQRYCFEHFLVFKRLAIHWDYGAITNLYRLIEVSSEILRHLGYLVSWGLFRSHKALIIKW